MITVHIVIFQTHDRLCHLLRRMCGARGGVEVVVRRAERIHLLSRCPGVLHHVVAPLKLRQVLLHLEIGLGRHVLLLLGRRGVAILVAV